MRILVDDRPYESALTTDRSVADLAAEVCPAEHAERRMVVAIRCDGRAVSETELEAVLSKPIREFESIELQTTPLAAMVQAVLSQAIHLFEEATAVRHRTADQLDEGRYEPAMQDLQKFFEIFRQLQDSMVLAARALGADLDTLDLDGRRVAELFEAIKGHLTTLKDAMTARDFVVVSDVLRYELAEPLDEWLALLEALRRHAG